MYVPDVLYIYVIYIHVCVHYTVCVRVYVLIIFLFLSEVWITSVVVKMMVPFALLWNGTYSI